MFIKRCLVVLVLVLLVPDGEAWWKRRRRRRARPPPCRPHDCEVSQWTHWSECSLDRCSNIGTQFRTRIITAVETCRGTCPYNLRQTRSCIGYGCQNGGTPSHGYCICRTGYAGTCCEQDVNECHTNRNYCSTGGTCVNTHGSYRCVCHQGYTSSHDGTVCVKNGKKTSSQDSNLRTYLGCGIGLGLPIGSLMLWLIYHSIKKIKKCLGGTRETTVHPFQEEQSASNNQPVNITANNANFYMGESSKGPFVIYTDGRNGLFEDIRGTVNRREFTNTPDQPPPPYKQNISESEDDCISACDC